MPVQSQSNRRMMLIGATMLATILYTVDSTIVNVALPHMQGSLQATQDQIAWVVTSYIVMSAIATPLSGWLGARFGLRRVMSISVIGFTVGSVACGLATNLGEAVLFRLLQGFFGAALVPLSQVALLQEYPRERHGQVMALWALGVMVGPILGPTLGGYLTDTLSWRWAFFINVPIGIVAYLGIMESMRDGIADRSRPFDWSGFLLLSFALGLFQLMLDRGHTLDWFSSTEIVAEAFFGAICLYMFVVHALTSRHPFIDPHLFRDRNFAIALALMFVIGLSLLSPVVLLPSFLQSLQGYSPTQAGVLQAMRGVASVIAVFMAGRMVGRLDSRLIISLGILAGVAALAMFGGFTLDTPRRHVMLTSFVLGFCSPLVFVPLSVVAYATLRSEQRTEASAILTLARNIGSSIGISIAVSMLARSTQVNRSLLAEHFSAYDVQRWTALGIEPGPNAGTAHLLGEIGRQAAAIGYANDYHLLALATVVVLPLVWLMKVQVAARPSAVEIGDVA
jgi:DHA2 family multidrug resistance protein